MGRLSYGSRREGREEAVDRGRRLLEALEVGSPQEAMVRLIFGEDWGLGVRFLNATAQAYDRESLEGLLKGMEKVESYNRFEGRRVARVLRELCSEGLVMEVKFGREGSPVLYVYPPYWENQRIEGNGFGEGSRKYSEEERGRMVGEILRRLRETEPDELWPERLGSPCEPRKAQRVRAWWD